MSAPSLGNRYKSSMVACSLYLNSISLLLLLTSVAILTNSQNLSTLTSDKMSNNIVQNTDLDEVIKKGEDSQKARQVAMEKRRQEEAEQKRQKEMEQLAEHAGRTSQQRRGKGI